MVEGKHWPARVAWIQSVPSEGFDKCAPSVAFQHFPCVVCSFVLDVGFPFRGLKVSGLEFRALGVCGRCRISGLGCGLWGLPLIVLVYTYERIYIYICICMYVCIYIYICMCVCIIYTYIEGGFRVWGRAWG